MPRFTVFIAIGLLLVGTNVIHGSEGTKRYFKSVSDLDGLCRSEKYVLRAMCAAYMQGLADALIAPPHVVERNSLILSTCAKNNIRSQKKWSGQRNIDLWVDVYSKDTIESLEMLNLPARQLAFFVMHQACEDSPVMRLRAYEPFLGPAPLRIGTKEYEAYGDIVVCLATTENSVASCARAGL